MTNLSPIPKFRATVAGTGIPLVGGQLFTYAAGSTPNPSNYQATYKDSIGTANTNPVILNSYGECDLWLGDLSYKFVLQDSLGNPLWTVDNVKAIGTADIGIIVDAAIEDLFIENFAAIASTTVVVDKIYYLKEYITGTGVGGGHLLGKAGSPTPNNGTIFLGLGGYFERVNNKFLTSDDFGVNKSNVDCSTEFAAFDAYCTSSGAPRLLAKGTFNVVTGSYSGKLFYSFGAVTINNNTTIKVVDVYADAYSAEYAAMKAKNFALAKSVVLSSLRNEIIGQLVLVGDSITAGNNSTNNWTRSYAARVRNTINEIQDGGLGAEDSANLVIADATSNLTSTTGSYGTKGALKSSLILDVGETLIFSGNYQYIDFMYERSLTAGSAEIKRDGVVVATKSMAGAAASDICTFNGTPVSTIQKDSVWTITATIATIEITGLIRRNARTGNTLHVNRIAKSGYSSADFVTVAQTNSIKAFGTYNTATPTYLLAFGTNDIYNAGKNISSSAFAANLETIILALTSNLQTCILTVPLKTNEAVYPPISEPHENYRIKILQLADKYNLPVIDFSLLRLNEIGKLADNIHPDDGGHALMASYILDHLGVESVPATDHQVLNITYNSTWVDFAASTPVRLIVNGNKCRLVGIADKAGSVSTTIGTIPVAYAPNGRSEYFPSITDTGAGTLIVTSTGNVNVGAVPTNWVSVSSAEWVIKNDIY